MMKTDTVKLDIDLIPEELYNALIKEFKKTRKDVIYVNEIEATAIIEYEE